MKAKSTLGVLVTAILAGGPAVPADAAGTAWAGAAAAAPHTTASRAAVAHRGGTRTAGAVVRDVHLPNCGGDYFKPCEGRPWYLFLRDGRWVAFPDAARYATEAGGRRADEVEDDPAPFAVSGDGRTIGYVRARDGRVVLRRWPGGKATVLPAYGKGVGTKYVGLELSADGRRALVDFSAARKRRPGLVIDVASGRTLRTLPEGDVPRGFSADGDEVLVTRTHSDNTVEVVAHGLDGSSVADTPPQVVVGAGTSLALETDGRTVVALLEADADRKQPEQVRRYDLRAHAWTGPARPVKPGRGASDLSWRPGGRLELTRREEDADRGFSDTWVHSLDVSTGALRKLDRYRITDDGPKR
ncbi:hypothetical protein ABT294_13270 [Nonomuraea sp. NPDC000554]|uniref:YncE family protein n=1 Tax=Nonomuraea sp. NPDC000554 TaxID=3154259 RepID=UPI00331C7E7B